LPAKVPDYGNWFAARLLYLLAAVAIFFAAISLVFAGLWLVFIPAIIGAVLFIVLFAYFTYARYALSTRAGDVQTQVRSLVLDHLDWDGNRQAIDIGCGNGALVIEIAKKFPEAHVVGIDYWSSIYGYSQRACEQNAEIEGVFDRVSFRRATASALPFESETFDAAVSNLVFSGVFDARDKREVIKEALRVVKKGGVFSFQDGFKMRRVYGDIEELLQTIRGWGVTHVEFIDTGQVSFLPRILRTRFLYGANAILCGRK